MIKQFEKLSLLKACLTLIMAMRIGPIVAAENEGTPKANNVPYVPMQRVYVAYAVAPKAYYLGKNDAELYWYSADGEASGPKLSRPAFGVIPVGYWEDGAFHPVRLSLPAVLAQQNECRHELNKAKFARCTYSVGNRLFPSFAPVQQIKWFGGQHSLDMVGIQQAWGGFLGFPDIALDTVRFMLQPTRGASYQTIEDNFPNVVTSDSATRVRFFDRVKDQAKFGATPGSRYPDPSTLTRALNAAVAHHWAEQVRELQHRAATMPSSSTQANTQNLQRLATQALGALTALERNGDPKASCFTTPSEGKYAYRLFRITWGLYRADETNSQHECGWRTTLADERWGEQFRWGYWDARPYSFSAIVWVGDDGIKVLQSGYAVEREVHRLQAEDVRLVETAQGDLLFSLQTNTVSLTQGKSTKTGAVEPKLTIHVVRSGQVTEVGTPFAFSK